MATQQVNADAGIDGINFILQSPNRKTGGIVRNRKQGHLVTITGRGGTGKSVLALQFLTDLLGIETDNTLIRRAFYFTLEASPLELARQVCAFEFGQRYFEKGLFKKVKPDDLSWKEGGLYVYSIPSPINDLSTLIQNIRQKIADSLAEEPFDELIGIAIDPIGGVHSREKLRADLSSLKYLVDSHKTYLFLIAEDHLYDQHKSIEYYSQTVLQLQHIPSEQPPRRIFVQKARCQPFRSGHHQLEIRSTGVQVFPSVEAQSAFAHDRKKNYENENDNINLMHGTTTRFLRNKEFTKLQHIQPGSVVFLMGPPGTFKQFIASNFANASNNESSLYISFKAEKKAVERQVKGNAVSTVKNCPKSTEQLQDTMNSDNKSSNNPVTWFVDARNPLSTPEEILSHVRVALSRLKSPRIGRAVVWGLRRLADMPNFSGATAVQFLEALVTLLQAERTTCLLVDWPDIEKGNTLPIVDLSQHILLTRHCYSANDLKRISPSVNDDIINEVWKAKNGKSMNPKHAVLLRVQRDDDGFHRDVGFRFIKYDAPYPEIEEISIDNFETCWNATGKSWEKDPGLS